MAYVSRKQERGYQGVNKLRRTLRRLEPEATQEIKDLVKEAGAQAADYVRQNSVDLQRTSKMYESIDYKVSRDGFTVVAGVEASSTKIQGRVNLGAIERKTTKSGRLTLSTARKLITRMNIYKAIYHEFGTKGDPSRNIDPIHPQRMHQKAFDALKPGMKRKIQAAINRALEQAARG